MHRSCRPWPRRALAAPASRLADVLPADVAAIPDRRAPVTAAVREADRLADEVAGRAEGPERRDEPARRGGQPREDVDHRLPLGEARLLQKYPGRARDRTLAGEDADAEKAVEATLSDDAGDFRVQPQVVRELGVGVDHRPIRRELQRLERAPAREDETVRGETTGGFRHGDLTGDEHRRVPPGARSEPALDEHRVRVGAEVPVQQRDAEIAAGTAIVDDAQRGADGPHAPPVVSQPPVGGVDVGKRVVRPPVAREERLREVRRHWSPPTEGTRRRFVVKGRARDTDRFAGARVAGASTSEHWPLPHSQADGIFAQR
jgi:hypothetical protein